MRSKRAAQLVVTRHGFRHDHDNFCDSDSDYAGRSTGHAGVRLQGRDQTHGVPAIEWQHQDQNGEVIGTLPGALRVDSVRSYEKVTTTTGGGLQESAPTLENRPHAEAAKRVQHKGGPKLSRRRTAVHVGVEGWGLWVRDS